MPDIYNLSRLTADVRNISRLDDEPNDVGGLTSAELKAAFDKAGADIKEFLNGSLIVELEALGIGSIMRSADTEQLKYVRLNGDKVLEVSADGVSWEATGSSGHVILDAGGNTLPQRSRMQFTNSTVTDDGSSTVVHGIKGDKGDRGERGEQGVQGIQGVQGKTGPAIVPEIDASGVMSFTMQETAILPQPVSVRGPQGVQGVQGAQGAVGPQGVQGVQGPEGVQGPRGIQGDIGPAGAAGPQGALGPVGPQGERGRDGADGRSFVIQDVFPTLGVLKTSIPDGDEHAYQVAADKEIYIWSEAASEWVSLGLLQGPIGPQGPSGATGPQGSKGDTGAQGPEGVQGPAGPQGIQGVQGAQGVQGVPGTDGRSAYQSAVESGYSGTETAFNAALSSVPEHIAGRANPHAVTAVQTGAIPASEKKAASGVAGTDENNILDSIHALPMYGTCATAAATAAKIGTVAKFKRHTGAIVSLKFTYANTAASPTLNINGTGAAAIYDYRKMTYPASGAMAAGVHFFVFDGTRWILLNPVASGGAEVLFTSTTNAAASQINLNIASIDLSKWAEVTLVIENLFVGTGSGTSVFLRLNNAVTTLSYGVGTETHDTQRDYMSTFFTDTPSVSVSGSEQAAGQYTEVDFRFSEWSDSNIIFTETRGGYSRNFSTYGNMARYLLASLRGVTSQFKSSNLTAINITTGSTTEFVAGAKFTLLGRRKR